MSNDTLIPSEPRPRAHTKPAGTSPPGLVGVELRRLWWRRLTKVAIVVIIAFVGIATYATYDQTNPEKIAQRVDEYKAMVAENEKARNAVSDEQKAADLATCRADEANAQKNDPNANFGCDQVNTTMTYQDFGLVNKARDELIRESAQASVYLLGFLAFLLGASFVAAEFTSGSMGNWLTFSPRRLRVGVSKLVAATAAGAGLALFGVALLSLAVTGVTTINRPDETLKLPDAVPSTGEPLALSLVRVVAVVALGGLGGAAIAFMARSTAAVIGLVVGYAVVIEGFVASGVGDGRYRPWTVSLNIDAFVQNGAKYYINSCTANGCEGREQIISYTHGWVYLLVLAAVGVAAALALFRRRDVT